MGVGGSALSSSPYSHETSSPTEARASVNPKALEILLLLPAVVLASEAHRVTHSGL